MKKTALFLALVFSAGVIGCSALKEEAEKEDVGFSKDDQIVTYCTAGIRSGYMQLILEMCGFGNSKNYDESYYRWCAVEEVE